MSDADESDQVIRAGDNAPTLYWRHDFDLAGSEAVVTVTWSGGSLRRSSADGDLQVVSWATFADDADANPALIDTVVWSPSTADRASIPLGRVATYALQRAVPRDGEVRTYFTGYITREA